jgi:broad specificity phosphatase PhoE
VTIIHLIRHGQSQRVAGDPGLTETGREQARRTALALQAADLAAVYASPLSRAQETATILAATLDLTLSTDPRLRERANWGDDPAQPLEAFLAMWHHASRERGWVPPVGDSARAAGERMNAFVREVAARHPSQAVAAVAHNGVIGDWLTDHFSAAYLGALHPQWQAVGDDVLRYCSVTTVDCANDACQVLCIGCTAHLA